MTQLAAIERLAAALPERVTELARAGGLPIHAFSFGTSSRDAPVLIVVGGVHGVERIGTEVAIAFLEALDTRLGWDAVLAAALRACRIVVVPLLNPVGMARGSRANGNGVDLMRNAPAHDLGGTPLLGGQRLSSRLPWYMGRAGAPMEIESAALVSLVEAETAHTPFALALDLHSGYGLVDRVWYPYARTREPIPDAPALAALGRLLDAALPHHRYRFEQTAQAYTIRGDLWDHLYDRRRASGGLLLSLTLEMGAWTLVRGTRRTQRRHLALLDFLICATASHGAWC